MGDFNEGLHRCSGYFHESWPQFVQLMPAGPPFAMSCLKVVRCQASLAGGVCDSDDAVFCLLGPAQFGACMFDWLVLSALWA